MRRHGMLLVSLCLAAAVTLCATHAPAMWGKAKTKTEDGNAQMDLPEYKGLKQAIGVADFENESGWAGRWDIGKNLTMMMESALFDTGRFVLVEREKLSEVIKEQDLMASGRMAKAKTAAQTGKIRPARYLARGVISECEESQSGGGGGIAIKGIRVGGGKSEAHIAIIMKLIDTTTGEIVAKERIVGKAGRTALKLGLYFKGVGTDMGGFKKTPLAQAAQDCVNQGAKMIAVKMEEFPFEGSVVKVTNSGQIIINRGSNFGVETGQELILAEDGELLTDPDTGAVLGKEEGKVIGKIKVSKVAETMSYCDAVEGEANPPTGTVVKAQ
ncbi:MAG: hypothetical protein JXR37_01995 [Kiritimatiellae bacterium]|nr:hypothetical protein [Kiritimatiellia bacterium]